MAYDPKRHHRRSIRLQNHDYASPGGYFITICTHDRSRIFGQIRNGEMILNEFGTIAMNCWNALPEYFPHIRLDESIVMPNHFHGILWINEYPEGHDKFDRKFSDAIAGSIPTIIGGFKSATTRNINKIRGTIGVTIWQRNYYDRIIRDEKAWRNIQQYIRNNPRKWNEDKFHN